MSENTSWRAMETYEAMRSNQGPSHIGHGRQLSEYQAMPAVPIHSWHQVPAVTNPTMRDQINAQYMLPSGTSYSNPHGIYQPRGYVSSGFLGQDPARNTPEPSPTISGVNATSCIPYQHLNNCYAYALDRGNGQYTRLIPADCLPPSIPLPRLQSTEGLIILSAPRGQPPPEAFWNKPFESAQPVISSNRPFSQPGDPVQSTIDNIVANFPQAQKKRTKVYCDKWLHEGVCAFAQQGCRYKHEMPMDKATQHSVGLFNGLPKWYKAKHADEIPNESSPCPARDQSSSPRANRSALLGVGSWRAGAGRGGSATLQKQISPPGQRTPYNVRSTGSPMASNGWRASKFFNGESSNKGAMLTNARSDSNRGFTPSPNAYDLLFDQDEAAIDDDEV